MKDRIVVFVIMYVDNPVAKHCETGKKLEEELGTVLPSLTLTYI